MLGICESWSVAVEPKLGLIGVLRCFLFFMLFSVCRVGDYCPVELGFGTHKLCMCKVVNVLQILQNAGLLETCDTVRRTRGILQKAAEDHAKTLTVYGPVVQQMNIPGIGTWEYCEPRAYLRHMSELSDGYVEALRSLNNQTHNMSVVLYLDEIVPGNPFRPDKARKLWGVYWACLEWPGWVLARSAVWPVLGVIKSKTLDACPGGVSFFWKHIVGLFKDSMVVQLVHKEDRIPLTLKYAGTLGDESALKQVSCFKGASGIKCCMDPWSSLRSFAFVLLVVGFFGVV